MLPPIANPSDLSLRLRQPVEEAQAIAVLAQASSIVRNEARKTWVTGDVLDADLPDIVFTITISVAARMWDNPTSTTSRQQGPFNDTPSSTWLLDDEREILSGFRRSGGLGTISTTRGPLETATWQYEEAFLPTIYSDTNQPGETIISDRR